MCLDVQSLNDNPYKCAVVKCILMEIWIMDLLSQITRNTLERELDQQIERSKKADVS
jgi:hypothetical protein